MNRPVKSGERWTTFIFDGIDCAELGVYSITNGGTYTTYLTPNYSDKITQVTAYDGGYYYGTQITGQRFTFNMFADNLTFSELTRLKAWLNPRKVGKLIFSEQPYKYYYVKPTSVSTLSNIPLSEVQTPTNSVLGDMLDGDAVYTGKFTITFETVGSAYGYGISYFRDDLIYDALDKYGLGVYPENYFYNSGLLYKDMCPAMTWDIDITKTNLGEEKEIPLYNPGDAKCYPKFKLDISAPVEDGGRIHFKNYDTGDACTVELHGLSGKIEIDFTGQVIKDANGKPYYGRIKGYPIALSGKQEVITLPDQIVANAEDVYITEYDTVYVQDNVASINKMAATVSQRWLGWYFCINGNGGSKITKVNSDTNSVVLGNNVNTYNIPAATIDKDGKVIRPAGFECNYVEIYNDLNEVPEDPKIGDVYCYNDEWYIYKDNKWQETNLFSHKNEFRNIKGDYEPVYLTFGATIVQLDELKIKTDKMPAFSMQAEILPRYL